MELRCSDACAMEVTEADEGGREPGRPSPDDIAETERRQKG